MRPSGCCAFGSRARVPREAGSPGGAISAGRQRRGDRQNPRSEAEHSGHAIQPHLQKLNWDPIEDFAPVSLVVTYPLVVAVHPGVQANTLGELIAFAKHNPGKLSYGSSGSGSNLHLGAELFKSAAGVNIVHVPYKGNAPMTIAVLRGEVDMVFDSQTGPVAHIRADKLKVLGVTAAKRSAMIPEVPTFAEAGLANFEYLAWTGILAPAKTPKDIVLRLNAEIAKALRAPDARETSFGWARSSEKPASRPSKLTCLGNVQVRCQYFALKESAMDATMPA
jgi:tripartite-type tricarboxylate transporter receptor subunit TctC